MKTYEYIKVYTDINPQGFEQLERLGKLGWKVIHSQDYGSYKTAMKVEHLLMKENN